MADIQKYSCTNELGAEILVITISMCITITVFFSVQQDFLNGIGAIKNVKFKDEDTNLVLSLAYTLVLPLMSYLFSQAKQYHSEGRAHLILIWMVFIEIIRISSDPISTWKLRKSAEQLIRLFWVSYLIYSFTSLNGIKVTLFIFCVYFAFSVVLKGIFFNLAKSSYLIGNNPNLIHNYLIRDDIVTTPLTNCSYIVFGEENHEISVKGNGYTLGEKKSDSSKGVLTIGRVFQLNLPEDEAFTSEHPRWRDTCLSFALAKIFMCRFANLSLDEVDCNKARAFVLEGLIDFIGTNRDIQNGSKQEINPTEWVFCIIRDELDFLSDFIDMRMPLGRVYPSYYFFYDGIPVYFVFGCGVYLISTVYKKIPKWLSFVTQDSSSCFLHGYVLMKHLTRLDQAITIILFIACIYIHVRMTLLMEENDDWCRLTTVRGYFNTRNIHSEEKTEETSHPSEPWKSRKINYQKSKVYRTVFDIRQKKIFFCLKINWSTILRLPKWVRRTIPRATPTVKTSTNAKEAILVSLKESGGQLTNGETSINKHGMNNLNWACNLQESTTEVILVWHIATTLFFHSQPPQSDNPLKEQEVALELSNYCHYLVAYHPELLPNVAEGTTTMYEYVIKDIMDIDTFSDQESTKDYRCQFALQYIRDNNSVIGTGVKLAKDLIKCAEDGVQVQKMLAEFWAEMMLFIAPSDNVEGHKKILHRGELITQLWALLTHAGIISRPKRTEHHHREGGENSNGENGDDDNSTELLPTRKHHHRSKCMNCICYLPEEE